METVAKKMKLNRGQLPWNWYRLALVLVIADQLAKLMANMHLIYGVPVEVLPVFNLTLQHNTGAAFSFLHDAGGWQRWFFSSIAAVVSVVLVVWMARLRRDQHLLMASLACVLGGAVGNLIDRVRFGYVVDYVSLHYGGWYFPAFNVADAAITVGAGLMILDMVLHPDSHGGKKSSDERS